MSGQGRERARTSAAVRHSRWPGWIWAVPIAAILIVAWLLFRHFAQDGTDITIFFADAHGMRAKDTNIEFHGMKIGNVTGLALSKAGNGVEITAKIDGSADRFLTTGTKFWLRGASPSLTDLSSLGSILSGPTIMMQPGPGSHTTRFTGLEHKPLFSAHHGPPALYVVNFTGPVGVLQGGDTVSLRGFTVGEVQDVEFRYDRVTGALATPVVLALYPEALRQENAAELSSAMQKLVGEGLRARLAQDPPLIGSWRVTLDLVPGAPDATVGHAQGLPEIPVAPGGGLDSILAKFNKVPLDQIAQNLLDVTHRVDALVGSPKLADSIAQLDATLRQVHETTAQVGPKVAQLTEKLRAAADQIDQVAQNADKTLGGAPSQNGVNSTLREVTDAARSIRELANYLDSHPEALIKGRSGQ